MSEVKFSVGVSGDGKMFKALVKEIQARFPRVVIYDRNEEANRPPSDESFPAFPQVADISILFSSSGTKEAANIQRLHRHSFFNYDMSETPAGSKRETDLLNSMLDAISFLLKPPEVKPPPLEQPAEDLPPQPESAAGSDSDLTAESESDGDHL